MSFSRWDPWADMVSLRDAMNNLVAESYVRSGGAAGGGAGMVGLALDVQETADNFVVTATVPGVKPDDVEITVLGDTLRIQGERREHQEQQGGQAQRRWLLRERAFGAFERTITLPTTVNAGAANAEFQDGILTVTLPKADQAKPRTIPVRAGAGGSEPTGQP